MTLSLTNQQRDLRLAQRTVLLHLLRQTLTLTGLSAPPSAPPRAATELGFALVTRAAIARLNAAHLQHHGPTDVITFDYRDPADPGASTLGDIVVCPALAIAAAPAHGHSVSTEAVLYLVHGILHLAGHDDLSPGPRRAMRRAEAQTLAALSQDFDLDAIFTLPVKHTDGHGRARTDTD